MESEMKMNRAKLLLITGVLLISSNAFAGNNHGNNARYSQHGEFVYAKVIEVTPVYREVSVNHPVKECWSEPVKYRSKGHYSNNSAANTLAGGIIGGIIGHQIGGGRGKDLATAVGTIIGAQAGHDSSTSHYDQPSYDTRYTRYEEHCETQNRVTYSEVIDSYNVKYSYRGKKYMTNMPYNPGDKVKLQLSFDPVI